MDMRRAGLVIAIAAIAGGVLWYLQRPDAATSPPSAPAASAVSSSPPLSAPAPPNKVTKVTRLANLEQRRELAERIAASKASRTGSGGAAIHARPLPQLPATPDLETYRVTIQTAMSELLPHLKACYEAAISTLADPTMTVAAEMTLTGDRDIGTVVDAKALVDHQGKPLPAAFDDCLRSNLQLMALPPLEEGDELLVNYTFAFATDSKDSPD